MGTLARRVGRDHGLAAPRGEPVAELVGIIGAIRDQRARQRRAFQQGAGADEIVAIARRDREGDGTAVLIGYGVNFSRPSAARSSDGVGEGPPFPPAAERCALTCVESIDAEETTPLDPVSA